MPSLSFAVPGKPMGKPRTTYRQKFVDPKWQKWLVYKCNVIASAGPINLRACTRLQELKERISVNTMIYFQSDGRRPDPVNVRRGIIDALFSQDRNVVGSEAFAFDREAPRVEVTISWND